MVYSDIFSDAALEKMNILRDCTEQSSVCFDMKITNWYAVQENFTRSWTDKS